jgi:hypothetical protein
MPSNKLTLGTLGPLGRLVGFSITGLPGLGRAYGYF